MTEDLKGYQQELQQELQNILAYWMRHTIDETNGGFYGKIENDNTVHSNAPKGSVLNSRVLWTFSAAYNQTKNKEYLKIAERAYDYIVQFFIDKEYGGVYWSVDHNGQPLDTKKQIYAIAFAVYGLSEFYAASQREQAKQYAIALYEVIEQHSHDKVKLGYIEALTKDWKEIDDLRLSEKDSNEKKSMNTHLHILEAYANLYRIWPDEGLKKNIIELINLFLDHIIDPLSNHLRLFFDEDWNSKGDIVSYGHDIEAAWLVQEAAEIIRNETLINQVKKRSVLIATASERGLDKDGGLWYEKKADHLVKEKHWWPQSEAMVGFYNAYELTGDNQFLARSLDSWKFIQRHLLDNKGEWYWGVREDYTVMEGEDKIGMWKCPYHNGRACIELIRRIDASNEMPDN
jgi:mannobiose 2-epimerase